MTHRTPSSAARWRTWRTALALVLGVGAAACGSEPPHAPDPATLPETPGAARFLSEAYPILEARCLDCHHSDVAAPWYASIPLLGDPVRRDVEWGRQRFDLARPYPFLADDSEHGGRGPGERSYLYALRTALLDDTMPPTLYLVTHPFGSLSDPERGTLLDWVESALDDFPEPTADAPAEQRAEHVLRNRCARCHSQGVDADMNGAFDYVTDLAFLAEDDDYIEPEDAEASPLFERLVDDADPMPPSPHDRLSEREIEWIAEWIDEGAEAPLSADALEPGARGDSG